VAEKASVAKAVSEILSRGSFKKYFGVSKFNPIFEFDYLVKDQPLVIKMTSVAGHLMNFRFPETHKNWQTTNLDELYSVRLEKATIDRSVDIVKNLQNQS